MSESSLSHSEATLTTKKTRFPSLLVSDFHLLCSFILSHPLHASFFVFLSPYLTKIFSFLSPLFITSSLFFLALLGALRPSLTHDDSHLNITRPKSSFLLSAYCKLTGLFRFKFDKKDEGSASFEEPEAYKMVFEPCPPEAGENPVHNEACSARQETFVDKFCSHETSATTFSQMPSEARHKNSTEIPLPKIDQPGLEGKTIKCEKEDTEVKRPIVLTNEGEGQKEESSTRSGSKTRSNNKIPTLASRDGSDDNDAEFFTDNPPKLSTLLGKTSIDGGEDEKADFTTRREREWRRTLACKLFEEERRDADVSIGGEGMDLLWETYESEMETIKKKKKSINELYGHHDDDDDDDGQVCCLKALKISTGKMHLRMGRPGLVKISKAFAAIRRFHHVTKHTNKI